MADEPDRYALSPDLEAQRLRSLDQLHIFHSPAEDRFAHITRMARVAMGMPMAAINFIDRNTQWCKQYSADHQLDFNVPRDQSVCRATIARAYRQPEDPALVYEDLADSEFAELPAVAAEGGVRFYAGFPLYGPGGHPVGTFCVYDSEPRRLSTQDRATFEELAAWAQRELQSSDELRQAAQVQQQMLPAPLGDIPGYTAATLFEPAFSVAGDFYDHYPVPGGLNITLGDVMGKGLGAAIVAANVRSALRAASHAFDRATSSESVASEIAVVDQQLADDLANTNVFVTLFHCALDTASGAVTYIDAGHGLAAILRRSGEIERLRSTDLPLGINVDGTWTAHRAVVHPGDMLAIASDGLLDLLGDRAEPDDVFAFLAAQREPDDICHAVRMLAKERAPSDDVTVVAVRRAKTST